MLLNNLGELVEKCWMDIPDHFPNVEVKPFMVMPNHIHGIITIYEDDGRGTIYRAPTTEKFGRPVIGSVPTIIRTYKASVSRIARRELGMVKIWQRNYYEHIIRNELELKNIACYISINPETWADDPEYQQ
jgi:REP element-mobilizing transposase RayT